jgi:plasmid stability protein
MSTTLTIRNLDEGVKQKLRLRAASHQRSMEAEAREILANAVAIPEAFATPHSPEEMRRRIESVIGIWKDQMDGKSTDEMMQELRGDE